MKINGKEWLEAVKKSYADQRESGAKPASGEVCAVASLRCVRDWLLAEIKPAKPDEDKWRKAFRELINDCQTAKLQGFASNASASASAAGYKAEATGAAKMLID